MIYEYIWVDANGQLRGKTKISTDWYNNLPPVWNFDGSSTGQAPGSDSEVELTPIKVFTDPFRPSGLLVFCASGSAGCNYNDALTTFQYGGVAEHEFWFGIEQEYVLYERDERTIFGWPHWGFPEEQGKYYCGVGTANVVGREIIEEHMNKCMAAGLTISGVNAEVMLGQWEYQIGPCLGIDAAIELWVSRYILHRVCETYNVVASLNPKPVKGNWNGSGCHTNFSTKEMRGNGSKTLFENILNKLSEHHPEHMAVYGENNSERLTGTHETSNISDFSWGIGDRSASVRIPKSVVRDGYNGYMEDRRPGSNMDPFLVTSVLARTITVSGDMIGTISD